MSQTLNHQSSIMQKNVSALAEMQDNVVRNRRLQDKVAAALTEFSGSMAFVYIHAIWFGAWMLLNVGLIHVPKITGFDPYPFGLLTLVVSLEAIFLSTFVLIAQNNLSAVSEKRSDLDLHINLLAEQKTAKILELLDTIGQELDSMSHKFNYKSDPEIDALKLSPEPHEVLQVIEETANGTAEVRKDVEEVNERVDEVEESMDTLSQDVDDIKAQVKAP